MSTKIFRLNNKKEKKMYKEFQEKVASRGATATGILKVLIREYNEKH